MDSNILSEEAEELELMVKDRDHELKKLFHAYQEVFKTDLGRTVIMDILQQCHVFSSTMTGNSWTYFKEGERKIGLYVLGMIDIPGFKPINMKKDK